MDIGIRAREIERDYGLPTKKAKNLLLTLLQAVKNPITEALVTEVAYKAYTKYKEASIEMIGKGEQIYDTKAEYQDLDVFAEYPSSNALAEVRFLYYEGSKKNNIVNEYDNGIFEKNLTLFFYYYDVFKCKGHTEEHESSLDEVLLKLLEKGTEATLIALKEEFLPEEATPTFAEKEDKTLEREEVTFNLNPPCSEDPYAKAMENVTSPKTSQVPETMPTLAPTNQAAQETGKGTPQKQRVEIKQTWYAGKGTALEQIEALRENGITQDAIIAKLITKKGDKRGFGENAIGELLFPNDASAKDDKTGIRRKLHKLLEYADNNFEIVYTDTQ